MQAYHKMKKHTRNSLPGNVNLKILMCKPSFYDIEYEINPWMNKRIKPEQLKASVQWKQLHDLVIHCGAEVITIEPQQGLLDMVFTANAGIVRDNKVLLSHHRHRQRQAEKHFFKQWFIKAGYEVLDVKTETNEDYFEGEGDAIFSGNQLFAGFGIRTDKAYCANLSLLFDENIIYCELVNPYFYHLNTCFNPLDGDVGIWWPEAFTTESQSEMHRALDLIAIPEKEARYFACNAVVIDKNIILPTGCPETERILKKLGHTVYACDMSEFIKAGGASRCLTLAI